MKIVIGGAGGVGRSLAGILSARGDDVVLLDRDAGALAEAEAGLDVMSLEGDITHRAALRRAEVASADGFVAVTGADPANLVGAALSRGIGARVTVARVDAPAFYLSPTAVESGVMGIDSVLCATWLASSEVLRRIVGGGVPCLESFARHRAWVALLRPPPGARLEGRRAIDVPVGADVELAAVVRDGFLRRPVEIPQLAADDALLVAGAPGAVARARWSLVTSAGEDRAMVVGGGEVGIQLARELAHWLDRVELVDVDSHRCEAIASELIDVSVLAGDARNVSFLQDQQVDSVDHLVAVTRDDEVNLLVALLGRQLGAKHAFALVHRPGYAGLYARLGVTATVEKYGVLAASIAESLIDGGLVRQVDLPRTTYSLVEWRLSAAPSASAPLAAVGLPPTAIPLLVVRDEAVIRPQPDLKLTGGETLLIACPRRDVSRLPLALPAHASSR